MPKFILFIREDLRKYPIPDDQLAALISAHSNWARTLASQGKFIDGYGITPQGMLVEKKNDQLIESPLRDLQEGLGGLYILEVADMQEAISIAKKCPTFDAGDIIEVRPLM